MHMPLHKTIQPHPECDVYIWEISEAPTFFIQQASWDSKQLQWLETIHPEKKLEYLASRYLIHRYAGLEDSHLYKNEHGKLFLRNSQKHLSISHSDCWTGLALGNINLGFDLQVYKSKIQNIASRFLSDDEHHQMITHGFDSLQDLCLAWAMKEAIYKQYGKKGIIFSEQIRLQFSDCNKKEKIMHCVLALPESSIKYIVYYEKENNFTWALAMDVGLL